jgi:hypothetical protein
MLLRIYHTQQGVGNLRTNGTHQLRLVLALLRNPCNVLGFRNILLSPYQKLLLKPATLDLRVSQVSGTSTSYMLLNPYELLA